MKVLKAKSKLRSALLFVGLWTLVGLIFAALTYASEVGEARQLGFSYALRLNLVRFYLWAGMSPLIFRFTERFPIEFRPLRVGHLLLHIPAILLFALTHLLVHSIFVWMFVPYFKESFASLGEIYRSFIFGGLYLSLIIASLIVIASHAFLYYQSLRAAEIKRSALTTQLAQAQLQALKMQLHPHFLFNTLHSISSLVLEDPSRANSMIARLGDFLRLTLDHSEEQMVMLDQEIEFLRCYLEIQQVRFEDRLNIEFKIESGTLGAFVPHLILQPVVENAIQHAIAPRAAPGFIEIQSVRLNDMLRLTVKDDGPGIKTNGHTIDKHGVGLHNVSARLKQIYGNEYSFEMANGIEGGLIVVLKIPFQVESSDSSVHVERIHGQ